MFTKLGAAACITTSVVAHGVAVIAIGRIGEVSPLAALHLMVLVPAVIAIMALPLLHAIGRVRLRQLGSAASVAECRRPRLVARHG